MAAKVPAQATHERFSRQVQMQQKRAALLHEGNTDCNSPHGHEVAMVLALLIQAASRRE